MFETPALHDMPKKQYKSTSTKVAHKMLVKRNPEYQILGFIRLKKCLNVVLYLRCSYVVEAHSKQIDEIKVDL